MEKYFKKIEIITDKASAIRSTSYSINELFENKEDFYKNIVDTIFDIKNLALYLTGISSEDDFLVEDTDDVMSIFQGLFKNRFLLKLGYSLNNDIKMVLEIVSFLFC